MTKFKSPVKTEENRIVAYVLSDNTSMYVPLTTNAKGKDETIFLALGTDEPARVEKGYVSGKNLLTLENYRKVYITFIEGEDA